MQQDFQRITDIFKALSDEKRLKIITMLAKGSLCACNILEAFEFTQPALSQHMKVLTSCGLVSASRVGNWMHYTLNFDLLNKTTKFISNLSDIKLVDTEERCKTCN